MAAAPKPKNEEFSQFAIDALKAHNNYRKKHGVPALTLNKKLCEYSQQWADICAKDSKVEHRDKCPYGENIYSCYSTDPNHKPSSIDVVKAWYDEIKNYKFGKEKVIQETLHFTQVVWRESKELGIAIARNKKGHYFVVANYDPRGNFIGRFVENVPKPRS